MARTHQAFAAVRADYTLGMPGARSAHPFRARCPIGDERAARDIRLSLGGGNPWCPARMTMHTNADSCYGSKTRFSACACGQRQKSASVLWRDADTVDTDA